MISREELNPHGYKLTPIQEENQEKLFGAINLVREEYGKPMIVTSGVRSKEDQLRINPRVKNSAHMQGAAVDISDPDGSLWGWCMDHIDRLIQFGLYLESRSYTPRWVHFQCIPPHSGNRIFLP